MSTPAWAGEDQALSLLNQHGWKVDKDEGSTKFTFSKTLQGNPELFYQRASQDIGLDLRAAQGKELSIRKFLLTARGPETGAHFWAAIAVYQGKVIGAWLFSDAPIAPGIASLKDHSFVSGL